MVDGISVGRSHGVRNDPGVGRAVDLVGERRVASDGLHDLLRQSLGPDSPGDAAAQCGADVIRGEVET